nr:hypothetical protein BgiMline_010747 [Biomphalaria glabrata]
MVLHAVVALHSLGTCPVFPHALSYCPTQSRISTEVLPFQWKSEGRNEGFYLSSIKNSSSQDFRVIPINDTGSMAFPCDPSTTVVHRFFCENHQ